jgi:hypothetical protein
MILECKDCSAIVNSTIIAVYEDAGEFDPENGIFEPEGKWTFAYCPKCKNPMLALQCNFGNGFDDDIPSRVFPVQDRQLGWKVPDSIKRAFNEAVTCFNSKAFTASAIMCRKSLEGLCAEHGAKAANLSLSLKKLRDKEIIENRLFEWAEALRTLGNEAAHGVDSVISPEDAKYTLDFTEALIQYVFTYQDQFQEFKKKRGSNVPEQSVMSDE